MIDVDYLTSLENILTENRKQKFIDVLNFRTNHFTVAIEDVFQLHNTSAVMRSCDVFGIQNLHIIEERFSKKIDKEIAMGAEKWVDINRYETITACVDKLKLEGYQIVATTPHRDDCDLKDFDIAKKSAFFFGTERNGLSQEIIDAADTFLKIPMVGFTESLNLSVSAAIILHSVTERLRNSELNWQLTENEMLEKRLDWSKKSIKDIKGIEARYFEVNRSKN